MKMRLDAVQSTILIEDWLMTNGPVTTVGGFDADFCDRTLRRKPLPGDSRIHGEKSLTTKQGSLQLVCEKFIGFLC
jgi:hypothetical protein